MATLIRWNTSQWTPLREFAMMQSEVSRVMNGLFEGSGRSAQTWAPTVDAWETERELLYAFDLPGVSQDSIEVELDDGALTVRAERARSAEITEEHAHRLERRHGVFARTVELPRGIGGDAIGATYADGVLEVRVRKPEQPRPQRIKIGVERSSPTIEGAASTQPATASVAHDIGTDSAA
jgi:HSP20 family protein